MPLPEALLGIGDRIVEHFDQGGSPPFQLYVYDPSAEWEVRREFAELRLWLGAANRQVNVAAISLARLFWAALEEAGWLESLIEAERAADGDPVALSEVYDAVGEVLRDEPTLPDRVRAELLDVDDRTAVFLYRAGALYPAYRTSSLLDDLRSDLRLPVTLLYPGRVVGDFGLSFMRRCEPAYGYRARIVSRGGDE
ncbi:BREX protein BrxB domain-containing protein [Mycobacterium sp. E2733]|uniref:BREX protein BrxB domain-containing protein n=1 Tax=Mycobacterium sp. E2733 TaxID=1834138 RepID=UPI0007FF3165|nr:BREX protein BrxB domain-containing protein [Mycobacterium sp. E2733]OBH94310.1 hypothetical protein A5678_04595 [Mycobacterium sp. E2733]